MPPWKPHPDWGEFRDARHLTEKQVAVFQKWVAAGTPEGDAKDLPPQPAFKDGWKLGKPDLVLEMPEAFDVPAEGADIYRCFVIPTSQTKDQVVSAVEFRPGNRRVVHHALFYAELFGQARRKDAADPGPGFKVNEGLGASSPPPTWVPGRRAAHHGSYPMTWACR